MKKSGCSYQGFTLIEVLVVVLIVGLLAAIALPQYNKAVVRSRLTQGLLLAKSVRDAQRIYYLANAQYAEKLEDLDIDVPGCTWNEDESTEIKTVYDCDNNMKLRNTIDTTNGVYSIYVYIWNSDPERKLFIEDYFKQDLRLCGANFSVGQAACQGMGGTEYATNSQGTYYELP